MRRRGFFRVLAGAAAAAPVVVKAAEPDVRYCDCQGTGIAYDAQGHIVRCVCGQPMMVTVGEPVLQAWTNGDVQVIAINRDAWPIADYQRRSTECPTCGTRIDYDSRSLRHVTLEQIHDDCHVCKMARRRDRPAYDTGSPSLRAFIDVWSDFNPDDIFRGKP